LIIPPWVKLVIVAAVALAGYAWGRVDGSAIEERKHLAYVAQQAEKKVAIVKADEKTVYKTEVVYRDRIQTIREKGNVIIKEVPVYVQATDNEQCVINTGFVRIHRASTNGEPAGTPADTDREASGINLSTVAEVDAENNKNHRACREQVIGWQAFYAGIRETRKED
jgi:hypothetical protein